MNKNHNIGRDLLVTLSENKIKFTVYVFVFFILANIVSYLNYLNQSNDYYFKIDINKDYLSNLEFDHEYLDYCNDPLEKKINDIIDLFIDGKYNENSSYLTPDHKKLISRLILYECEKIDRSLFNKLNLINEYIQRYISVYAFQKQIWKKYLIKNNLSKLYVMPNIKVYFENDQIKLSLKNIKKNNLTINFINYFIEELNSHFNNFFI